jgi:hypothetical protein
LPTYGKPTRRYARRSQPVSVLSPASKSPLARPDLYRAGTTTQVFLGQLSGRAARL